MTTCLYRATCIFDRSTWPQTSSSQIDVGRSVVRTFPIELALPALASLRESNRRSTNEPVAGRFGSLKGHRRTGGKGGKQILLRDAAVMTGVGGAEIAGIAESPLAVHPLGETAEIRTGLEEAR
jgi:hypothetical protein